MAYKKHQSAQLGIEKLVLLYTPSEMLFFLDLHAIIIRMCAAFNPDRYAARSYPRMWSKAKIEFTVFVFVLENYTKQKIKFVCKNLTRMKGYFSMQIRNRKASRRVNPMNKFGSFSAKGKFGVEINTERLHTVPADTVSSVCWSIFI